MVVDSAPGVPASASSPNSSASFYALCEQSVASNVLFSLYTALTIFVLAPLFALVLCTGFKQWRRQRRSPAVAAVSNTDFFTYNMMAVEISGVIGTCLYSLGSFIPGEVALMLGATLSSIPMTGQTLFHLLNCLERHLAVVHPIAYMQLREAVRVRIRNICSVIVWLFTFGWLGVTRWYYPEFPVVPYFFLLGVCVFVMLCCCASVLRALVHHGPGQEGGRKHADPSKMRAFQMIMAITGTLILRSVGVLFWLGFTNPQSINVAALCVFIDLGMWLMVPSSLVLPLLFLHRAGKLSCSGRNNES